MKIKVLLKKAIGFFLLNPYYLLQRIHPIEKGLVLLADGHQNHIPYSLEAVKKALEKNPNVHLLEYYKDYSFCGIRKALAAMLGFIPLYARAEYVFISDCYIPAASCFKRKGTTLVQLWHSSGLLKKVGCDSPVEKHNSMQGQYRNTDYFTASAPIVADTLSRALNIPRDRFIDTGTTRMDLLTDTRRTEMLKAAFLRKYPAYRNKKLILWAPTFRGNAHNGYLAGEEEIFHLQQDLGDEYAVIIKTHRFSNSKQINTPVNFSAEQLLTFADILITDYSSIYFDYLFFRRPVILFAPDFVAYEKERGIYLDYTEMPGYHAYDYNELLKGVLSTEDWADAQYKAAQDRLWEEQMLWCNGKSCTNLLSLLGLN